MTKKTLSQTVRPAFTLIELLVYIALTALVLPLLVNIGQNLITSNAKAQGLREISFNVRALSNQITQSVRSADDVATGSSTFNVNPGVLNLDYPGSGTNVIIDTYTKSITVSGMPITIRKLRIKEGTLAYQDLTSDKVTITNFIVRNLTRGTEPNNINIELSLNQVNPANDADYNASISTEISVSLPK